MRRLLDRAALKEKKGIDYSDEHIRRLVEANKFPKPISFQKRGKNFWDEAEVDEYIEAKLAERDGVAA